MVIEEDDDVRQFVEEAERKIQEELTEITRLMWEIEDMKDTQAMAEKAIIDNIRKRKLELNMDRDHMIT